MSGVNTGAPAIDAAALAPSLRAVLAEEQVPSRTPSPAPPATAPPFGSKAPRMLLELADHTEYQGISFGAEGKSIAGECVFQTGA